MKEHPMLFSAPMVRAILEGRKTQTRRVVKRQPEMVDEYTVKPWAGCPKSLLKLLQEANRCPYEVGMRLWVRETWCSPDEDNPKTVWYRADADDPVTKAFSEKFCTWRPSIHMPRWASRITLEITGVRVERVQDISEKDVQREGIDTDPKQWDACYTDAFIRLWTSIYGPESWAANPWVWVVEFKRRSNID